MPTLTQQEAALRSSVYKGFYTIAVVAPQVTDDRNKGHVFGSRWLRTDAGNEEEFVCLNNAPGAAVWVSTTTSGGPGGGIAPHIAITNPTINDDTGDGYAVGQLWVNTVLESCFVAIDVSTGAAIWAELTGSGTGSVDIHASTNAPTINDDVSTGIAVGDIWVRTTDDTVYVCADDTDGAAVWVAVNGTSGSNTHIDTIDPTTTDDSGDGYTVGQIWVNTTSDTVFCATDVTVGAAVWVNISNNAATAAQVSATPAANNNGTNVQAQLDNINNAIANVFFMGRLLSLAYLSGTLPYTVTNEILNRRPTYTGANLATAPLALTPTVKPTYVTSYSTTAL